MSETINVAELIETFRDMARRETLLARGGVMQDDLLAQIEGTIIKVASGSKPQAEYHRRCIL